MTILRDNWVSVPPGILVGLLSRTSIALLLNRLFAPYKWFTYYLISFTILMWIVGIVEMPLTYLQVTPVEALWNFTIVPEKRWDTRVWLYTTYFYQCMIASLTECRLPSCVTSLTLSINFCSVLHFFRSHICLVPGHLHLEAENAPSTEAQSYPRHVRFRLQHDHVHLENDLHG